MNPRDMMAQQMAGGGPKGPPPGAGPGGPPPMGPEPDGDEGGQFPPELIHAIAIEVVKLLQGAAGSGAGGPPPGPGGPPPMGGMA